MQSKCSIFRGVILCLCLNLTYANIVRFPRELNKHGTAFLVPYLILLLVIGLPIVLLEISLGQFLGQGSAHIWRASPFFRGKFYHYIFINKWLQIYNSARGMFTDWSIQQQLLKEPWVDSFTVEFCNKVWVSVKNTKWNEIQVKNICKRNNEMLAPKTCVTKLQHE